MHLLKQSMFTVNVMCTLCYIYYKNIALFKFLFDHNKTCATIIQTTFLSVGDYFLTPIYMLTPVYMLTPIYMLTPMQICTRSCKQAVSCCV